MLKMANARKTIGARAYNVHGDNDKTSIIISNFCVVPNFCVVLCIVSFVSFSVLFLCICVLYYCHQVATQLQLNITYRNINCAVNRSKAELNPICQLQALLVAHPILHISRVRVEL
jgi:hypothetical protein